MAWTDDLIFPCEVLVVDYKPFPDDQAHNMMFWCENKADAERLKKKFSGYTLFFGVSIWGGDE